jgi:hypothetical protein
LATKALTANSFNLASLQCHGKSSKHSLLQGTMDISTNSLKSGSSQI